MRRIRRPQLALIGLLLALAIGYAVEALSSRDHGPARPTPAVSATGSASSLGVPLWGLPPQAAPTVGIDLPGPADVPASEHEMMLRVLAGAVTGSTGSVHPSYADRRRDGR